MLLDLFSVVVLRWKSRYRTDRLTWLIYSLFTFLTLLLFHVLTPSAMYVYLTVCLPMMNKKDLEARRTRVSRLRTENDDWTLIDSIHYENYWSIDSLQQRILNTIIISLSIDFLLSWCSFAIGLCLNCFFLSFLSIYSYITRELSSITINRESRKYERRWGRSRTIADADGGDVVDDENIIFHPTGYASR